MDSNPILKAALLHYWLVNMRGGEKVLQEFARMYPNADLFTHVIDRSILPPDLACRNIRTTFIQKLPQACKRYQQYLPLMPLALEELDLRSYDLVISSESGPVKGVVVGPRTTHICYCLSPMRYVWDMYHEYMHKASLPVRLFMRPLCHYLRLWDHASACRVDEFISISRHVAERVRKFYGRDSSIIAPPVHVETFIPETEKDDYYLFFGELVGYKRADLAVEAFRDNGKRLIVAGKGEQLESLRKTAPPNVTFTGSLPFPEVKRHLARAKALIFPGIEDFGIVPVEAMASGTPVLAFREGGALDTVLENQTGMFFDEQTPQSLNEAIHRFESGDHGISTGKMRAQAEKFSPEYFEKRFRAAVDAALIQKSERLYAAVFHHINRSE